MKLVELLADKLENWADTTACYVQDPNGIVYPCISTPEFSDQWIGAGGFIDHNDEAISTEMDLSTDYSTAIINKAQWQSERDRQKGGEWKRHRGGNRPVDALAVVEVKLRDGTLETHRAECFNWRHDKTDDDIMSYRVISQPQAEEVEVKDTTIGTISYKISVDQIAGPLAWRDSIIHCQAIIEDCEREIQANVNLLDSEGLFMQLEPKKGMQAYDVPAVDMGDYLNWNHGDILRCVHTEDTCAELTVGREYTATRVNGELGVIDDAGDHMCYCIENANLVFIRRP